MDKELEILMKVARRLPRVRGAGRIATVLHKIYQRKKREPQVVPVLDFEMRLNPNERVDVALLLYPQLYDRREVALLRRELRPGDVFLDLGAHIGFYSLLVSGLVGAKGKVISVEADPEIFQILQENIRMNGRPNIDSLCTGLSDREETLRFGVNLNGNRGSSSFLAHDQPKGINVSCVPLSQIILERGITKIAAAKVDIEGFGVKTLRQFYQDVPRTLWPPLMIIEDEPGLSELMRSKDYKERGYWGFNRIYQSFERTKMPSHG